MTSGCSADETKTDPADKSKTTDPASVEKHACKGKNTCKNLGGCGSGDNGCKAKNSCKSKGGCASPDQALAVPPHPSDPPQDAKPPQTRLASESTGSVRKRLRARESQVSDSAGGATRTQRHVRRGPARVCRPNRTTVHRLRRPRSRDANRCVACRSSVPRCGNSAWRSGGWLRFWRCSWSSPPASCSSRPSPLSRRSCTPSSSVWRRSRIDDVPSCGAPGTPIVQRRSGYDSLRCRLEAGQIESREENGKTRKQPLDLEGFRRTMRTYPRRVTWTVTPTPHSDKRPPRP